MAVISDAADELASLLDHLQTDDEQTQPAINGLDGSRDLLAVDWSRTADVAQRCADSLKSETVRTRLGQTQLLKHIARLLRESLVAKQTDVDAIWRVQIQLARVVGNLVLDHPQNRIQCTAVDIPYLLLQALTMLNSTNDNDTMHIQAIKACTGALLNLVIDTPDIRETLVKHDSSALIGRNLQLYPIGVWTTQTYSTQDAKTRCVTVEWSMKLLVELFKTKAPIPDSLAINLTSLISSLQYSSTSSSASPASSLNLPFETAHDFLESDLVLLSEASELLENQVYDSETLQNVLAFSACPQRVSAQLVASSSSSTAGKGTILQELVDFIENAQLSPAQTAIAKRDLDANSDSLEATQTFSHIKASVARIVVGVSGSDRVMEAAFVKAGVSCQWLVDTAVKWLKSSRADLVISGATILANVARKDEYCASLVHKYDLAHTLAALLVAYANPKHTGVSRPGEATQVLYAITGLVKNLSIAGENKQVLCDAGLIPPLAAMMATQFDVVPPLQTAAVGAVKHLCAGNVSSALKVSVPEQSPGASRVVTITPLAGSTLHPPAPLETLLALNQRTSEARLRFEAARVLVNIIRSLYSARSVTSPITPAALGGFDTAMLKGKARQALEGNAGVTGALAEMMRTAEKYPILVNEAIIALTLLTTTSAGAESALTAIIEAHTNTQIVDGDAPNVNGTEASYAALEENDDQSAQSSVDRRLNGSAPATNTTLPYGRSITSSIRNAPSRAIDIAIKWLNDYAIESAKMPPEMAANALSLIDGLLSRANGAKDRLPISTIRHVLQGIAARRAETQHEKALQTVAASLAKGLQ